MLHELGAATARVSYREGVALLEEAFAAAVHPHRRGLIALELAHALSVTLAFERALAVLDEARAGLDDGSDLATELAAATVGLARRDPARRAAAAELTRTLRRDGRLPAAAGPPCSRPPPSRRCRPTRTRVPSTSPTRRWPRRCASTRRTPG
ncbi:hypothetical protein [Actinomycetospora sp. CA-053990]|uniref:hypothetical protein n=1 Tax=Actinomycetospora sp. CA-053990 TaxID=3239891 RepID=UPI003D90296B